MKSDFEKIAMKVSFVSIVANVMLSAFKLFAGIFAHSGAMVSDAVHSASDVFSTIVVIIGIRISGKKSDKEHPYGHERMECVAAIVLATILAVTGLGIGYGAVGKILSGDYANLEVPGFLALVAALVSIAVKEGMYWYTRHSAKKIDSSALMADAWHHSSDALSSVAHWPASRVRDSDFRSVTPSRACASVSLSRRQPATSSRTRSTRWSTRRATKPQKTS